MKSELVVSLAQVPVVKGDVSENLKQHLKWAQVSAKHGANLVVFPELSLIGYELELADTLAFTPESAPFKTLSNAAVSHQIAVIAGCPLRMESTSKPTLGAVICLPDGEVSFYSKQYLHEGEEQFFNAGSKDYFLNINGYKLALAICADFVTPAHSDMASSADADIYLVSALISENGFSTDASILSSIASKHQFPVLLANHISRTGGWQACGNNAIWNAKGKLVGGSESKQPGLVLCSIANHKVDSVEVVHLAE